MGVEIVIDKDVLDEIYQSDKYNSVLKFWLSEHETKAVIFKNSWNEFMGHWEKELKNSHEIRVPFLASIRGIVTPYRTKYGDDLEEEDAIEDVELAEMDSVTATITIVNRHYATCKFLIVKNPQLYRNKGLKIGDDNIVTPHEFLRLMEIREPEFIRRFNEEIYTG